jgi:integrase
VGPGSDDWDAAQRAAGVHRDGLDFDASTLTIGSTRVVIDGKVVEEDGKSDGSRRTIALDPYTLGVLRSHMTMLDAERAVAGEHYQDHGLLFCWEDGRPPHSDTMTARFNRLADAAGLPRIRLHDVRHSYATAAVVRGCLSRSSASDSGTPPQPSHSRSICT